MAKPTRYPDWALIEETSVAGAPNKEPVPTPFKNSGLKAGEPLPRAYLNDQLNLLGQWVRALEGEINSIVVTPSAAIIGQIYPVNSIYITANATDPGTQFGFGTWSRIQGKFLVGRSDTDPLFDVLLEEGGTKTHSHGHNLTAASAGSHTHSIPDTGWGVLQTASGFGGANRALSNDSTPSVAGKLVVGSGRTERGEDLESLAHNANSQSTGSEGNHTHTMNGGVLASSNLPPYSVVNIWRRTA